MSRGFIKQFGGQGISDKNGKILILTLEDFVNICCIMGVAFVSIATNYKNIMKLNSSYQFID